MKGLKRQPCTCGQLCQTGATCWRQEYCPVREPEAPGLESLFVSCHLVRDVLNFWLILFRHFNCNGSECSCRFFYLFTTCWKCECASYRSALPVYELTVYDWTRCAPAFTPGEFCARLPHLGQSVGLEGASLRSVEQGPCSRGLLARLSRATHGNWLVLDGFGLGIIKQLHSAFRF